MKIAVLVSGGVDSSLALKLLKDQGHDLTAFYLKIWLEDELDHLADCPWQEDLTYVTKVCQQFDVPLEVLNFQKEYFDSVVNYTINEVKNARTPNPDIMCNSQIKFGFFLKKIQDKNFNKIATGHYAQIHSIENSEQVVLKQAPDAIKDQTYFLSNLSQEQLQKIIFPIGHLAKNEVRELAQKYDLPSKDRKDSQGICFLGKFKFSQFIEHYLGTQTGDIIEYETGEKLGEHQGFYYYTIGQRKGIRLGGGPWFVVAKDSRKNLVFVSKNYHSADKDRKHVRISDFNWFLQSPPSNLTSLKYKLRHGPDFHHGKFEFENDSQTIANITLEDNDQGIAPGQFVAFYQDDLCLGSAKIIPN